MGAASFEKLVGEPEDEVKEKQPPNEKKKTRCLKLWSYLSRCNRCNETKTKHIV